MGNPNTPSKSTDPYQEPPDSTVDDWHGQVVKEATEKAEEALEHGADPAAAEREYDDTIDRRQ